MSTVLPNTPSQKSKEQMLSFFGGYVKQNKGAHHEHQQGLGAEKPATKRPRSYMEGLPCARAGFFLYIYLSLSTYLSLYKIYIYIHTSLSLSLSQVKLLERAYIGGRTCALRNCNKVFKTSKRT